MTTIEEITLIHAPIERCFDLARSVEVHLAGFQFQFPGWSAAAIDLVARWRRRTSRN